MYSNVNSPLSMKIYSLFPLLFVTVMTFPLILLTCTSSVIKVAITGWSVSSSVLYVTSSTGFSLLIHVTVALTSALFPA